jgi:hypothetical protein
MKGKVIATPGRVENQSVAITEADLHPKDTLVERDRPAVIRHQQVDVSDASRLDRHRTSLDTASLTAEHPRARACRPPEGLPCRQPAIGAAVCLQSGGRSGTPPIHGLGGRNPIRGRPPRELRSLPIGRYGAVT